MESERTGQDVHEGPLHADPEPEPDLKDPTTKGAAYRKTLEEEPDGEPEPDES
jgi:hypothetical protein